MAINACRKGKAGEREAAAYLRELLPGVDASRGQQHAGGTDSPDIKTSLPGVHFEVKRVEALNLGVAIGQAVRDAGENVPVVLHRRNKSPWLVTILANDLPRLARIVDEVRPERAAELAAADEERREASYHHAIAP